MSRVRVTWLAGCLAVAGCASSFAGNAQGTCTVRSGGLVGSMVLPSAKRTDRVELHIDDVRGGAIRIHMQGCDLFAKRASGGGNPRFVITHGHCDWNVPGVGPSHFKVANNPPDPRITDAVGEEAYVNLSDKEIIIVFDASTAKGPTRFACDATRR